MLDTENHRVQRIRLVAWRRVLSSDAYVLKYGHAELPLTFLSPWYLLLLAVLPAVWWFSFRRLAALGPVRRWVALALRTPR